MLLLEALLVAILHQIQGNIYIAIKLERSKLIKQSNKVPAHYIFSYGKFLRSFSNQSLQAADGFFRCQVSTPSTTTSKRLQSAVGTSVAYDVTPKVAINHTRNTIAVVQVIEVCIQFQSNFVTPFGNNTRLNYCIKEKSNRCQSLQVRSSINWHIVRNANQNIPISSKHDS